MRRLLPIVPVVLFLLAGCAGNPPRLEEEPAPPPPNPAAPAPGVEAPAPTLQPEQPDVAALPKAPLLDDAVVATMDTITTAALADSSAIARLTDLCDRVGARLNGSPGQRAAVAWAADGMRTDGLADVRDEPVTVPHWVRGEETCTLLSPYEKTLTVIGLGGTDGTPPGGITADLIAVHDFDELNARASEAVGRIVLFDEPWQGYGRSVRYRFAGAVAAARCGAVGCLIRSVTGAAQGPPHTGVMRYDEGDTIPHIPAAALSVEDAELLHRQAALGLPVRVHLEMDDAWLPDAESANVIGEIPGREQPEQIVLLGAHLDSWDVGCGAQDDGAGCVIVLEAARLIESLGLHPRRTIRVVLFADEEMTQQGGRTYARDFADELPDHVAALECDSGGFAPAGFSCSGDSLQIARLEAATAPLTLLGAENVTEGHGGTDISFLEDAGVPLIGNRVHGEHYFDVHHSAADTVEKVDAADLQRNVAAVAALAWALAEEATPLR